MIGTNSLSRPWGRRLTAALLPLLLAACSPAEPPQEARPAMWLVEDDDTRIYMLGTMHALPRATAWKDGKVAEAIAAAAELVMELSPGELAAAGEVFRDLSPRREPLAMERRLPPEALARYRALEARGGAFDGDRLDDWAVTVLMGQRVARNARLKTAHGVEPALTAAFRAAGKPVRGLETAKAQLMLFETLDAETQRVLLVRAATRADRAEQTVDAMTAAWRRGDVAALEKVINEDIDVAPAARRALISDRNQRWSAWAAKRMAQPGTVLMAVGAGHLVGADGVPAMLEAKGYRVTRVQ